MASHQRLALWDSENEPQWAAMPAAAGPDIHGPPPFRHPLACHNMALTYLFQLRQRVVGGGLVVLRQHLRRLSEGVGTRGSRREACVRGSIGPTASVHLTAANLVSGLQRRSRLSHGPLSILGPPPEFSPAVIFQRLSRLQHLEALPLKSRPCPNYHATRLALHHNLAQSITLALYLL